MAGSSLSEVFSRPAVWHVDASGGRPPHLSEFRTRLLTHGAEGRLFEAILELARGRGLLKGGGRQRSDSTHVLGAMRTMSRLEVVGETLRHALNALATAAPDWLRAHTTPAWVDRYGLRASEFRLPKNEAGRRVWARQTGVDGFTLLALATADGAPPALRSVAALETLRRVWVQNFLVEHGPEGSHVDWRTNDQVPPSSRCIGSTYDPEARYATKGATVWSGYKVHTIRAQSTIRPRRVLAPRRRAAQRDDMADLQVVLVNDDALDDELQNRLLVGERGVVQPAAHAFAERGQVEQELLGLSALAT